MLTRRLLFEVAARRPQIDPERSVEVMKCRRSKFDISGRPKPRPLDVRSRRYLLRVTDFANLLYVSEFASEVA